MMELDYMNFIETWDYAFNNAVMKRALFSHHNKYMVSFDKTFSWVHDEELKNQYWFFF